MHQTRPNELWSRFFKSLPNLLEVRTRSNRDLPVGGGAFANHVRESLIRDVFSVTIYC